MNNAIQVITPYRWNGMWVFDDPTTGLVREPFVGGADDFIEALSNGQDRFNLVFSDQFFPGAQLELTLKRPDRVGHTYEALGKEAWLCPALLLYFQTAPPKLFAQSKPFPVGPAPNGNLQVKTNKQRKVSYA